MNLISENFQSSAKSQFRTLRHYEEIGLLIPLEVVSG
jgi:hypothetical protein